MRGKFKSLTMVNWNGFFARTFDPGGDDGYNSVILVPASSKTTLEDILRCDKTLNFGIGDAKSTSGTLAPKTFLFTPKGVTPTEAGLAFFERAKRAIEEANEADNAARGAASGLTGNLRQMVSRFHV